LMELKSDAVLLACERFGFVQATLCFFVFELGSIETVIQ